MGYNNISVRKLITYLNNRIEQGGFWLPYIQKEFVWKEEEMEDFFEAIMRQYPIGMLLLLKTKREIKYKRFVSTYSDGVNVKAAAEPINSEQKLLMLDGQQRLQSLFIALNGSYNGKELYFNVLSGCEENSKKYDFKFLDSQETDTYWVKVKDVVNSDKKSNANRRFIISKIKEKAQDQLTEHIKTIIDDNLDQLIDSFVTKNIICYDVLDDTTIYDVYDVKDICKIIMMANLQGSKFSEEDLKKAFLH